MKKQQMLEDIFVAFEFTPREKTQFKEVSTFWFKELRKQLEKEKRESYSIIVRTTKLDQISLLTKMLEDVEE